MAPDGAKMGPKPSQEGSQRHSEAETRKKKQQDGITNPLMSMFLALLGPILEAQGRPREAQDPPKREPRAPQRPPEVGSRIELFFYYFFRVF